MGGPNVTQYGCLKPNKLLLCIQSCFPSRKRSFCVILLYIFAFFVVLCCVCNGNLPSYPSSTAKTPHRKLRKSLNTCYRLPKDEGVNILWMQIEKRGEMIRRDPLTKVPSYVFVTCKFPTCRPIWYLRSVPVCENASVHQQQQAEQRRVLQCKKSRAHSDAVAFPPRISNNTRA